jgi:hypothetical protein
LTRANNNNNTKDRQVFKGGNLYLHVWREERQLQRPPVLHAAGDHAGEDEPPEADRHRGFRQLLPGSTADAARRELELARRHDDTVLKTTVPLITVPEDMTMIGPRKLKPIERETGNKALE